MIPDKLLMAFVHLSFQCLTCHLSMVARHGSDVWSSGTCGRNDDGTRVSDMHPPTPLGDEEVDVFEPKEEDIMDTGILDDSDAEASDPDVADDTPSACAEATPAPTAAESHVHEVVDVAGRAKLSKLAALRIVCGQRPPT